MHLEETVRGRYYNIMYFREYCYFVAVFEIVLKENSKQKKNSSDFAYGKMYLMPSVLICICVVDCVCALSEEGKLTPFCFLI